MDEEFNNKVAAVQHNEDRGHCVGLLITKVSLAWTGYKPCFWLVPDKSRNLGGFKWMKYRTYKKHMMKEMN